jgi:HAD superfamily hydrolase (TIGR01509 family)
VKKPHREIYQIALDITHRAPDEAVFIDDRQLNLDGAKELGIHTIEFQDVGQLRSSLAALGVE